MEGIVVMLIRVLLGAVFVGWGFEVFDYTIAYGDALVLAICAYFASSLLLNHKGSE